MYEQREIPDVLYEKSWDEQQAYVRERLHQMTEGVPESKRRALITQMMHETQYAYERGRDEYQRGR